MGLVLAHHMLVPQPSLTHVRRTHTMQGTWGGGGGGERARNRGRRRETKMREKGRGMEGEGERGRRRESSIKLIYMYVQHRNHEGACIRSVLVYTQC